MMVKQTTLNPALAVGASTGESNDPIITASGSAAAPVSDEMPRAPQVDKGAAFANTAARFASRAKNDVEAVRAEVARIINEESFLRNAHDENFSVLDILRIDLCGIFDGSICFPRLEQLHRLLCGTKDPNSIIAVDNGPGFHAHLASALATLGSSVIVKDPFLRAQSSHRKYLERSSPAETFSRVTHMQSMTDINAPMLADIVYWTNPPPNLLFDGSLPQVKPGSLKGALSSYLGRDVKPGGYLILQTDSVSIKDRFSYDIFLDSQWRKIFSRYIHGIVMPTSYHVTTNTLIIYQRI